NQIRETHARFGGGDGQVPNEKRRLLLAHQVGQVPQDVKQRPQERKLDQDGQAPAQGVDFVLLIQLQHLALILFRLVLVLLLQLLQLGLQLAHGGQRPGLAQSQRVEGQPDGDGQQNDAHAQAAADLGEKQENLSEHIFQEIKQSSAAPVSEKRLLHRIVAA